MRFCVRHLRANETCSLQKPLLKRYHTLQSHVDYFNENMMEEFKKKKLKCWFIFVKTTNFTTIKTLATINILKQHQSYFVTKKGRDASPHLWRVHPSHASRHSNAPSVHITVTLSLYKQLYFTQYSVGPRPTHTHSRTIHSYSTISTRLYLQSKHAS